MSTSTTMTKAVALFATASIAVMGLAACSSGSGGPIQIEYLHRLPDADGMVKVQEIADRWNAEHPEVQVKATKFDGKANEMAKKLEADVKAGTAPASLNLATLRFPKHSSRAWSRTLPLKRKSTRTTTPVPTDR